MEWKELYQIVSETSEEHLCVEDFIITNTQLGEGQYGKVFLGYLKSNHTKLIAVKTVCTKKITKKTHSHLLQEIGIMRELNHVNLVKLYDHKQFNNNIYIFLEYCNENNLQHILFVEKCFTESICKKIMRQLINGMYALYQKNIIHRDIKPENILIHNGIVKIADFGFSRHIQHSMDEVARYTNLGTPNFMSPQILNSEPYSHKTDVWSLGVLFFNILYGQLPFIAKSKKHLQQLISESKNGLIFPSRPVRSQEVKDLLQRMMVVEESDRISLQELIDHEFMQINKIQQGNFIKQEQLKQQYDIDLSQTQEIKFSILNEEQDIQDIRSSFKMINEIGIQKIKNYLYFLKQTSILYNQAACCCYNLRNQIQKQDTQIEKKLLEGYFILQKIQLLMMRNIVFQIKNKEIIGPFGEQICNQFFRSYLSDQILKEFVKDLEFLVDFFNTFIDENEDLIYNHNLIRPIQESDSLEKFRQISKVHIENLLNFLEKNFSGISSIEREITITKIYLRVTLNPQKFFPFEQQSNLCTFYEDLNERTLQDLKLFK